MSSELSVKIIFILFVLILILLPSCTQKENEHHPIRLAYLQSDLHHLPAYVALERGFFKQEGLSVELSGIFKAGPELMTGFTAGDLDVGYVGLSPAIVAVAHKTAQVKVISQVNKNGSAIVVSKDAPFNKLINLKGKIVAIPGHSTIQDFLLRKALTHYGLNHKLITIITIKPPEMISILNQNQLDAFIAWEPYPTLALGKDLGKILIYSKDIWQDHPCCVLVVSTKFLKNHPLKVNTLFKAHLKSIKYIEDNFWEAVKIGSKYTGMDKNTIELALANIHFDHQINTSQLIEYIEFLNKLGYTTINDPQSFAQSFIIKGHEKKVEWGNPMS